MTTHDPGIHDDGEFIAAAEVEGRRRAVVGGATIGISPKVYVPALLQLVAGVVLLLLGYDVEGRSLIVAAVGTLAAGGWARPGKVQET